MQYSHSAFSIQTLLKFLSKAMIASKLRAFIVKRITISMLDCAYFHS